MASTTKDASEGFTAEERAAIKERAKETRKKANGEADLLAKIAEMDEADRVMAERIHAIVTETAPELMPKTWYGQPAYAKDGQVVVFFQAASKFGTRYATLGFNEAAQLDDGAMWPTAFALTRLTAADERRIAELVRKALG
ncbi:iron chaperone [Cellulomonas fengjieae]|uniref:DUF1801 domain-containing protein n=1 Tax=Cellulomonas fengjieae TaxID=2819978 RepID=A0ABS3SJC2_9CELL|nr:DUF1801 domain-containing protein [Cellulomonas fengjieae]MBO3085604.1 DUF1801 domain-containing protein [Cellulomonas fengjieae]QVI67676.1 DUF1801 domain-containing protein [Cellulomonas fengjieae]